MNPETVLIVGAGHAAGEMSVALRSNGFTGTIALFGEESHPPYQRPALSKGFLTGEISHEQLYVRSVAHLEKTGIELISNARVTSIDRGVEQARFAAAFFTVKKNMPGAVPWGWSDQYKCKLQIVGLNQGYDRVVLRDPPDSQSFLAFYLRDGAVLAIDAVNRVRDFVNCKKLVAAQARVPEALLQDESQPLGNLLAMQEVSAPSGCASSQVR
jgi:NADPH-dependent 2,4-dienoyl-CoA reductase/sulfur reductase-like enzyme